MSFNSNIIPGAAPLQWSNVYDAFTKINENFDILVATVGDGSGLTPIDFGTLDTNVSPTSTNIYKLGDITHQWKAVHTAEWAETLGSETNGLWAGSAQIKGKGLIIDLPIGSTIDGDLIIDPDKTFFKSIQVNNDLSVEATEFGSVVNLLSGLGIDLSVSSGADSITIEVDPTFDLNGDVVADNGRILVNATTGFLTGNVGVAAEWRVTANSNTWKFRDDGMLEWPSLASFGDSGSSGDLLSAGAGNNLTLASEIDIVLITDSDGGGATWVFSSVGELTVPGPIISEFGGSPTISLESSVIGGAIRGEAGKTFKVSLSDGVSSFPEWVFGTDGGLTFPGGATIISNMFTGNVTGDVTGNVSGNAGTVTDGVYTSGDQTIGGTKTFSNTIQGNVLGNVTGDTTGYHTGDVKGSVFADGSTMLVDSTGGRIVGDVYTSTLRTSESQIALGNATAVTAQGAFAIAIGQSSGQTSQGASAIAIGQYAGNEIQGSNAIAVGYNAGYTGQEAGAVAIGYTTAQTSQKSAAVAIGWSAGQTNQGANAIAIGFRAGFIDQNASSIVLNASGAALNAAAAGFFVNPVRSVANGKPLMYDTATSELSYSSALEFNGTTISTVDSSAVSFDRPVTFQGTVSIEGELRIRNDIVLDRRLTLAELEGVNQELNIYSDWAKDTGISIYSATGAESVTLSSNGVVGVVTGVGPTQKEWVFDTNGQIQFPDSRYQTGAAISIAELKVLVAATSSYAEFQTAIAALA